MVADQVKHCFLCALDMPLIVLDAHRISHLNDNRISSVAYSFSTRPHRLMVPGPKAPFSVMSGLAAHRRTVAIP